MTDSSAFLRSALLWGVPFAIVLIALGYETDWGRDMAHEPTEDTRVAPAPVAVALLPEYKIGGGVEARKETVDRVLFNPTRRPAPPATQSASGPSSMKHGLYTLTGTTVIGNVATAFLREVNGGKSHTLRRGESLNGALVAEVKPDHVRLKQGDDVEDLQLKIAGGPRTTIQVAAPVPPGAPVRPVNGAVAQPAVPGQGGTAAGNAATRVRPVAPPPPSAINPAATPRPAGSVSVSELLAERRRAARAAAAAAAEARQGTPQQ
jgi:hypothetical protein